MIKFDVSYFVIRDSKDLSLFTSLCFLDFLELPLLARSLRCVKVSHILYKR